MLRAIEFKGKRFRTKEDYNLFSPITKDIIILCRNYKLMDSLAEEILNTVNEKAEYNAYDCDDEDVGNAKMWLSFELQRVIDINGQRITLALEPSIIYKANDIKDIWFFSCKGTNGIEIFSSYEEFIYPMFIFRGSQKVWDDGKDEVYKMIISGRYGTYDGKWTNLYESTRDNKVELETAIEKGGFAIDDMEEVDNIREQIQCVTRLLKQLNSIRQLCNNKDEKKLVDFFYSILKMNCDNKIFNKEQLNEFRNIWKTFREEENDTDLYDVISWEKRLRETGLKTIIS